MASDLDQPRARIAIAHDDLSALRVKVREYVSKNVRALRQHNPNTDETAIYAHAEAPLPNEIAVRTGQITNETRSALEQLAIVLTNRSGNPHTKGTTFPIVDDQSRLDGAIASKLPHISQEDKKRIVEVRPYKGGHPHLYRLHQAAINHRHIALMTQAINSAGVRTGPAFFGGNADIQNVVFNGIPIDYLRIYQSDGDSEFKTNPKRPFIVVRGPMPHIDITWKLSFKDPPEVAGLEVFKTLEAFIDSVREIIDKFD